MVFKVMRVFSWIHLVFNMHNTYWHWHYTYHLLVFNQPFAWTFVATNTYHFLRYLLLYCRWDTTKTTTISCLPSNTCLVLLFVNRKGSRCRDILKSLKELDPHKSANVFLTSQIWCLYNNFHSFGLWCYDFTCNADYDYFSWLPHLMTVR